jgi:hypothetical protein
MCSDTPSKVLIQNQLRFQKVRDQHLVQDAIHFNTHLPSFILHANLVAAIYHQDEFTLLLYCTTFHEYL